MPVVIFAHQCSQALATFFCVFNIARMHWFKWFLYNWVGL